MDIALNYVGLAATTGLSAYVLAQLLSGDSASASLNAGMAGAGAWGYVAVMDSDVAKADAVPIIGYAIRGEIVVMASSSHFGGDLQQRSKHVVLGGSNKG